MILCVTLNPCLDKTLSTPPWRPGDNVRGLEVSEVVGGKGNNVARALSRLGRPARPATFLGGPVGAHCEQLLRNSDGFDPLVAPSQASTRVILTVRTQDTNDQSAFFDPDPSITAAEADDLFHRIEGALRAGGVQALTLSGSSPSPATDGLFLDLVSLARKNRVPVFLDTYGPALENIWGFWPDYIQLNRREAGLHLRQPDPGPDDLLKMLSDWGRHGVKLAIVTDGSRPIFAQSRGRLFRVTLPEITPVNPIGSGDCLLAGVVDSWLSSSDPETLLRHAAACGVANALVWDAGAVDPSEVSRLESEISVEPLSPDASSSPNPSPSSSPFVRVGVFGRPLNRFGR